MQVRMRRQTRHITTFATAPFTHNTRCGGPSFFWPGASFATDSIDSAIDSIDSIDSIATDSTDSATAAIDSIDSAATDSVRMECVMCVIDVMTRGTVVRWYVSV